MNVRDNVREFHKAFGIPVLDSPQVPSADRVRLRAKLISEEYFETLAALFPSAYVADIHAAVQRVIERAPPHVDIVEMADGLADLVYVCEGTFHEFGIDSDSIHAEVHRSNMAKVGGTVREDGKLLKPAGWTPPDIDGVLRAQAK